MTIQQVNLSTRISFDVEHSGRLVGLEHLENIGRLEAREVTGKLTGLVESMTRDVTLAPDDQLSHAERFEYVVVGSGVEAGQPLIGARVAGKEEQRGVLDVGFGSNRSDKGKPVGPR